MNEQSTPSAEKLSETENKKRFSGKKLKKLIQIISTVLLVACTLLCFAVVVRTAVSGEAELFGYRLFYVVTGSMEPTLPMNSLLLVGEADSYEVDDIITFYSKDEAILGLANTHRIVGKAEDGGAALYYTKGDANETADTDPITDADIIGKMYFCLNAGGIVKGAIELFTSPAGFFCIVLLPLLIVAVMCIRHFKRALEEELRRVAMMRLASESAEAQKANTEAEEKTDPKTEENNEADASERETPKHETDGEEGS